MRCPVRERAEAHPESLALVSGALTLTYADLEEHVARSVAALRGAGVERGARLGLLLSDDALAISWLLASVRLQAVVFPLSRRLPPAAVEQALADVAVRLLITDHAREFTVPELNVRQASKQPIDTADDGRWWLDLPATVILTSGSAGRPKAALHLLANHYWSAVGAAANMPLARSDRWLLPLPIAHVGGLAVVMRCVLAGAAVAMPADAEPLHEAIDRLGATHVSMVPTQLYRALESGWRGSSSLRAVLLGGAAAPETLIRRALDAGIPLHTSYGLTEMSSQVTTTPPGGDLEDLRTSGLLLPHRELRISAEGEIHVRGPTRFAGYVSGNECIAPFDEEGWFPTGDLGALDHEGRLRVTGRRDNRFISGGENIQPEAIEDALLTVPGVRRALVVPVPDEEFGELPVAFVEGDVPWESLRAAVAERLPRFCIPRRFHEWVHDESRGMKPSRAALRALARELKSTRS